MPIFKYTNHLVYVTIITSLSRKSRFVMWNCWFQRWNQYSGNQADITCINLKQYMGLLLETTCLFFFLLWKMKRAQISPQLHVPPSGGCISNQAVIFTGVGFIISASTIYRRHNTNAANRLFFTPGISGFFKKEKKKKHEMLIQTAVIFSILMNK